MSKTPKKKKPLSKTKNTRRAINKEIDNKARRSTRKPPQFKRTDKGKLA